MLKCEVSGKIYIGQTINFKKRLAYHFTPSTSRFNNNPIYADIDLYGKSQFTHCILENVSSAIQSEFKNLMLQAEKKWIVHFDSIKNGYNLEMGNELTESMKLFLSELKTGEKMPDETREKISKTLLTTGGCNKGKPMRPQVKEALLKANKGVKRNEEFCKSRKEIMLANNPFKGKKHSEESVKKISEKRKGMFLGKDNPSAREIKNIETGEIFETIRQAAEKFGLKATNISSVCSGRLKTTGGYHWQYIN